MNKALLILAMSAAITGCASSSRTYLSDGSHGYNLNCSGAARNWGMCIAKAGDLCGSSGYEIVAAQGEGGAAFVANASQNNASALSSSLHFRTMQIACKQL